MGECGPGPEFKFSKTDLQLCQREIATDEIQEKKNYRERSNIKSARVSALAGSVTRNMADAWQRVSALFRNRTDVARLSATSLYHSATGLYQLFEKNGI